MANDYKNNPKIKLNEKNLLDESYTETKNQKLRITTWLDGDIYDELRRLAKDGHGDGKYQTLMNDILRKALFTKDEAIHTAAKGIMDMFNKFIKTHPMEVETYFTQNIYPETIEKLKSRTTKRRAR